MRMNVRNKLVVSLAVFAMSGCVAAAPLAIPAAMSAADAIRGTYSDIKITKTPRYEARGIERVAFVAQGSAMGAMTGVNAVFIDNLSLQFISAGFDVIENSQLSDQGANALTPNLGQDKTTTEEIVDTLNLDGLFKVSLQNESNFSAGFLGVGANVMNGIISANVTLIDVETGSALLVMSANYKKAKPAAQVAEQLANAFRDFQAAELQASAGSGANS